MFGIVLAIHLFGVIFWIGGLLMLTSLLSRVPEEVGLSKERLLGAIRHLFEVAVNLGAAITIGLGIILIAMRPNVLRQGWLHAKLLLVAVILFYHVRFYRRIRFLQDNPSESSTREFRVVHGVVSLLTLAILMLAVLRPF
jgi:protoporphyrinogen IX oxidase